VIALLISIVIILFLIGFGIIVTKLCIDSNLVNIVFYILEVALIFSLISCICGPMWHISEKEYLKLSFFSEHWEELSPYEQATIGEDITHWNESLNNGNNYWFKFKIEDRSMYYIELEK